MMNVIFTLLSRGDVSNPLKERAFFNAVLTVAQTSKENALNAFLRNNPDYTPNEITLTKALTKMLRASSWFTDPIHSAVDMHGVSAAYIIPDNHGAPLIAVKKLIHLGANPTPFLLPHWCTNGIDPLRQAIHCANTGRSQYLEYFISEGFVSPEQAHNYQSCRHFAEIRASVNTPA